MPDVLTWRVVDGAAALLPADLRVGTPANLDTSATVVYEAPQNAHRNVATEATMRAGKYARFGLASEWRKGR